MILSLLFFGAVGIIAQSTLKIIKINERTPSTVSITEIVKQYFRSDFGWIILSFLFLLVWISIVHAYIATGSDSQPIPWVSKEYVTMAVRFINAFTAFLMYSSQSFIMAFTGKTEKFFKDKENG